MTKKQILLYLSGLAILIAVAVAVVKLFLLPPAVLILLQAQKEVIYMRLLRNIKWSSKKRVFRSMSWRLAVL